MNTIRTSRGVMPGFFSVLLICCSLPSYAQEADPESRLTVLLRLQPELVSVGGGLAESRGTDGVTLTDGWSGGKDNSGNWGALFIDGGHRITPNLEAIARFSLNINAEGVAEGSSRNRDLYVGLRGNFGEITAGRLTTPYKAAGIGWDPLNATFMQSRGNIGRSGGAFGHSSYLDRSLSYRKDLGPVQLHGLISFDDLATGDVTGDQDHAVSASAILPAGPISLLAAYIDGSKYEGGPSNRDATKWGIQYRQGRMSGAVMYESRGQGLENGDFIFAAGTYRTGDWRFSANIGFFDDDNGVNDGDYFAIGARYELHNQVSVHGGIRQLDRDLTGKERIAGLGLRIILRSGNLL